LSVGQPQNYLTCEEQRMKKATLVRTRKEAKKTKENVNITLAKMNAIRKHDMSQGRLVTWLVPLDLLHGGLGGRLYLKE